MKRRTSKPTTSPKPPKQLVYQPKIGSIPVSNRKERRDRTVAPTGRQTKPREEREVAIESLIGPMPHKNGSFHVLTVRKGVRTQEMGVFSSTLAEELSGLKRGSRGVVTYCKDAEGRCNAEKWENL